MADLIIESCARLEAWVVALNQLVVPPFIYRPAFFKEAIPSPFAYNAINFEVDEPLAILARLFDPQYGFGNNAEQRYVFKQLKNNYHASKNASCFLLGALAAATKRHERFYAGASNNILSLELLHGLEVADLVATTHQRLTEFLIEQMLKPKYTEIALQALGLEAYTIIIIDNKKHVSPAIQASIQQIFSSNISNPAAYFAIQDYDEFVADSRMMHEKFPPSRASLSLMIN